MHEQFSTPDLGKCQPHTNRHLRLLVTSYWRVFFLASNRYDLATLSRAVSLFSCYSTSRNFEAKRRGFHAEIGETSRRRSRENIIDAPASRSVNLRRKHASLPCRVDSRGRVPAGDKQEFVTVPSSTRVALQRWIDWADLQRWSTSRSLSRPFFLVASVISPTHSHLSFLPKWRGRKREDLERRISQEEA